MSKNLPLQKRIKQRIKGTHDSPCLSICTHKQGDVICKACGMLREEKKGWKKRSDNEKTEIRAVAKQRLSSAVVTVEPEEKFVVDSELSEALPVSS